MSKPKRAKDGQFKKQEKTGGLNSNKYNKNNPHPDHIKAPTEFTYIGKPRCHHVNTNGHQCHRTATIAGAYCGMHADVNDKLVKGTDDFDLKRGLIVALCQRGYTMTAAAAKVNINPQTVSHWRKLGKEALALDRPDKYSEFYESIELARLSSCADVENALYQEALDGNVTACIKYLACRMPDVWNDRRVAEIDVQVRGVSEMRRDEDLSKLSDEALRTKILTAAEMIGVSVVSQMEQSNTDPIELEPIEVNTK